VTQLAEKPKPEQVAGDEWQTGDPANPYLGSMGIYLFKREALERLLADEPEPPATGAPPAPPGGSDVHFGYVRCLLSRWHCCTACSSSAVRGLGVIVSHRMSQTNYFVCTDRSSDPQ